jgi:DNA-binding response OmpR family regulator
VISESNRPHVLAVDDDPAIRDLIFEYLTDNDLRVTVAADGEEMTAALEEYAIDLVVLDLRMPGEDGMKIARRLREQSSLPIIVVSGRLDEADRVMALELGADDYLTKPFSPRELLARIRTVLRRTVATQSLTGRQVDARVSLRWMGAQYRHAPADVAGRQARRAHQRRILPAQRVSRISGAHFDARAASRSEPSLRRCVRPVDRRPDSPTAPQDRGGPIASCLHQDRTRRRLHLRGERRQTERSGLISAVLPPQALRVLPAQR